MVDDHCCKLRRVQEEYDVGPPRQFSGDLDDYLVAKWKGIDGREPIGIRQLVEWFNIEMMKQIYRDHDRPISSTRIRAEFETLHDDDAPAHERSELVADLEADGIGASGLREDFLSKSTLYRHLKNCVGEDKPNSTEAATDWERNQLSIATNAFQEKVRSALTSLDNKGEIADLDRATVETPVYLVCQDCATRVRLETALSRGYVCREHVDSSAADDVVAAETHSG